MERGEKGGKRNSDDIRRNSERADEGWKEEDEKCEGKG